MVIVEENGYNDPSFKTWKRQFAFYRAVILSGRYEPNYFPLHSWVNSRETVPFNLGMATSIQEK